MKPNQEKKKTRPYTLMGLSIGIERAFLLIGLISGAVHSTFGLNPMMTVGTVQSRVLIFSV